MSNRRYSTLIFERVAAIRPLVDLWRAELCFRLPQQLWKIFDGAVIDDSCPLHDGPVRHRRCRALCSSCSTSIWPARGCATFQINSCLLVALIGGSAGAIAGQQYWRHKTQKDRFGQCCLASQSSTSCSWRAYFCAHVSCAVPGFRRQRELHRHLIRDARGFLKVPALRFPGTTPGGAAPRPTTRAVHTESSAAALCGRRRAVQGNRAARAAAGNRESG